MAFSSLLTIASVGLSVVGAVQQAKAAKAQAKYQAEIQRNNAIIAKRNAEMIRDKGAETAHDHGRRVRQTIGAAKAAIASNGLILEDDGMTTTGLLLDDLYRSGSDDIGTIYENTVAEMHRAEVQGMNFKAQAGLFDAQAASISPGLAGITAGIGALSKNADILF